MAWSTAIKKSPQFAKTAGAGQDQKKYAGIFSQQQQQRSAYRQQIHAEADNLQRFSHTDQYGVSHTTKEPLFGRNGEISGDDKRDVARQIGYAMEQAPAVKAAAMKKAVELTPDEKEQLLDYAYSKNVDDRMKFAQKPISIVYDRLDYIGFTSDILQQIELRQGTIPAVERDVNVPAVIVANDAGVTRTDIKGDRIFFDEFQLQSLVTVTIPEVTQRSYAIIDRIFEKVPRQIALREDRILIKALKDASTIRNTQFNIVGAGGLTKTVFENMSREIERHRLECDKFLMNRIDYGDIRLDIDAVSFDPVTSRDMFVNGYVGRYFDYALYVTAGVDEDGLENEVVPPGHIFAVAGPRYLGYQAIRVPLDVYDANQFILGEARYGWLYYKLEGMLISNPRSVVMGRKDANQFPTPLWLQ